MKYRVNDVARIYAKEFLNFLVKSKISSYNKNAYELFVYSIYSIYNIEYSGRLNSLIIKNGEKCIKHLKSINGVPKRIGRLSNSDKQSIIDCSCVYTLAIIQYHTGYKKKG